MKTLWGASINRDSSKPRQLILKPKPGDEIIIINETWKDDWSERISRVEISFDAATGVKIS